MEYKDKAYYFDCKYKFVYSAGFSETTEDPTGGCLINYTKIYKNNVDSSEFSLYLVNTADNFYIIPNDINEIYSWNIRPNYYKILVVNNTQTTSNKTRKKRSK